MASRRSKSTCDGYELILHHLAIVASARHDRSETSYKERASGSVSAPAETSETRTVSCR